MKKAILITLLFLCCTFNAFSQERSSVIVPLPADDTYTPMEDDESEEYLNGMVPIASFNQEEVALPDSLHLPMVDYNGTMPYHRTWSYPYLGGYWGWDLHEGFNANLDLSAFTSFGKNHFSGTAERISLMYAKALSEHLSIAIGGSFTNMNTNFGAYRTGGLSAIIDYRFNDHWEAYVYAHKNLFSSGINNRYGALPGMYAYDYFGNMSDRIGLGVRYNFNESTFVEVQLDFERSPFALPRPPAPMNKDIEKNNPHPSQSNSSR